MVCTSESVSKSLGSSARGRRAIKSSSKSETVKNDPEKDRSIRSARGCYIKEYSSRSTSGVYPRRLHLRKAFDTVALAAILELATFFRPRAPPARVLFELAEEEAATVPPPPPAPLSPYG